MSISTPVYATREDVKSALDYKETARNNPQIDRAIEAASRSVESLLHRRFYPELTTKYFDWPNQTYTRTWRLWLDGNEVISVSSLLSGGTTVVAADYFLEPANYGPPFDRVEIDLASNASFNSGDTHQRSIAITGIFGYNNVSTNAGTLVGAINSSVTSLTTSNGAAIGVGSLIMITATEHMLVTERTYGSSAQTLQTTIAAQMNVNTVAVTTGASFNVGELIMIDAEVMRIYAITGNNLSVTRAWDGSALAQHTSATTIYVSRTFTVVRAFLGTSAASHSNGDAVIVRAVPSLINELCIAEAINMLQRETSGYAISSGTSDQSGRQNTEALQGIRALARVEYGRNARMRAV